MAAGTWEDVGLARGDMNQLEEGRLSVKENPSMNLCRSGLLRGEQRTKSRVSWTRKEASIMGNGVVVGGRRRINTV